MQKGDWWSGVAYWYPLHPPLQTEIGDIQKLQPHANSYLFFLSLSLYAVWAWHLALPFFAWRRGWFPRTLLLGGAAIAWIGFVTIRKQPLFGPFYFVGALFFLTPDEWKWFFRQIGLSSPEMEETTRAKTEPRPVRPEAITVK